MYPTIKQSKGKRTASYALGFLFGISIASYTINTWVFVLLIVGMIMQIHKKNMFVLWLIMWVMLGELFMYAHMVNEPRTLDHKLNKTQEMVGKVVDVQQRLTKQRIVVTVDSQRVLMWFPRYPHVLPGDTVHTECILKKPEAFEGFAYDQYLKTQHIFYQCDSTFQFDIVKKEESSIQRWLAQTKIVLNTKLRRSLPEPHASFLAGILYGDRTGISKTHTDRFAQTGTSHILAVSGYNITIVTVTLLSLLTSLLIPRKKAVWLALLGVICFVLFVGTQASVVRAAIMGMVPLFARMLGRLTHGIFVLIYAATLMVVINPYIAMFDPGFQLSVAATAGLIIITPKLTKTEWIPEVMSIRESAIATIAAVIATLPLTLYHFGSLSLSTIPTNILIMPFLPLIMATGMLMLCASLLHPAIGTFAGALPYILISYVLGIIEGASKMPGATYAVPFTAPMCLALYGMIGWLLLRKNFKKSNVVRIDGELWVIRED